MKLLFKIQFFATVIFFGIYPTFAQENTSRLIRLDSISSDVDDKAPFVDQRDHSLFFSRTNSKKDFDIWKAEWKNKSWGQAKLVSAPFNNSLDNEIYHIDSSSGAFYFQKGIIDEDGSGAEYGIFRCQLINGQWTKPIKQKIKYFKNKSKDQSFCISNDGSVLILSIEGYTTHGVEDLYVSFRSEEDSWTEPQNLGTTINTKYEEFTPFLDEDNRTLYFASNGHQGGYGSKDIWVSYRLDDSWKKWSSPQNLGKEVNTVGMETSFRKLGLENIPFIVTSTRTSNGMSDIFAVQIQQEHLDSLIKPFIPLPEPDTDTIDISLDSNVIDTMTKTDTTIASPIESNKNYIRIRVYSKSTDLTINAIAEIESRKLNDRLPISKDSALTLEFDWLDTVHLSVKAENFLPQSRKLVFENRRFGIRLMEEFRLDSLEIGKNIKLENVLFRRGTPELLESSYENLDYVVEILKENQELDIEIEGHTDNSGNAYLNHILSEKRANTIKKYLTIKGIENERISTKGYGGSRPVASNDSEKTMQLNRRVEFKLLKGKKD